MSRKLPPFQAVTERELRELWRKHSDEDVRRLILEVVRYRNVITEIDDLYKTIHQSWRKSVGGNLVALHVFQRLMIDEKDRIW